MDSERYFADRVDPDAMRAAGRRLQDQLVHADHAQLIDRKPDDERTDPVAVTEATNRGRLTDLAAVRIGRMISSPFAFLRGSASLMAADLAASPVTGILGQICGDAHASNFGLYASPERRLVFDLNDFDETVHGPWEWDLRRLATSLVTAGRQAGVSEAACAEAARDAAHGYRSAVAEMAALSVLDAWYLSTDETTIGRFDVDELDSTFERVMKKARKNTSRKVVDKFAQNLETDEWRFVEEPPVLVQVDGEDERVVVAGLEDYAASLTPERRFLLSRFAVADVAFRVVGLGSVGLRSYVGLLRGTGTGGPDDALVLQIKEARRSSLADWTSPSRYNHHGERIVRGQHWMQTANDIFLGWTTIDERAFIVRQFRDMKGAIDPTMLKAHRLDDYARVTGAVLGRAHCQSIAPQLLDGYLSGSEAFDEAMSEFAVAYADRTEADHAVLLAAVRSGRIAATEGV